MNRMSVMLAAALITAGISSASFAQTQPPAPASPTIAQPAPTSPPLTPGDDKKAAKKAERQDKRMACRDQAKQQDIKGDPRKDFMKSCMHS